MGREVEGVVDKDGEEGGEGEEGGVVEGSSLIWVIDL